MSTAIAQQLALVFMGRALDSQWASSTANLLNGSQPSVALQTAFYNAAVAEGVFSTSDSPSQLVNDIFLNIFGFGANTFEQTAWGNLINNGTITKQTAAWEIFKAYLASTTPAVGPYKVAAQSKLVAMDAYSTELLADAEANLALAGGGTAATTARAYVSGVTSQATAATAIAGVAASVDALTVVPGTTYTLTTGVDSVPGTANKDIIVAGDIAAAATWSPADNINGGDGIDTFTVAQAANFTIAPASSTVSNVEIVNITSGGTVALNTVTSTAGFTGLTTLNTTSVAGQTVTTAAGVALKATDTALAAGTITVDGGTGVTVSATGGTGGNSILVGQTTAAKGTVVVSDNQNLIVNTVGGDIKVKGGSTINISATTTVDTTVNANSTLNAVTVTGTTDTTAVTVVQSASTLGQNGTAAAANANNVIKAAAGIVSGAVTINDANAGSTTAQGTISSVTLQNYGISTISSSGLTTLTLSATGTETTGTLGLTSGLTTGNPTTLALNLGGGKLGIITDASNKFSTVNVNTTANTTLGGITDTALKTLNVSGSGVLTLSATNAALTSVGVTGAAGLKADLSGAGNLTSLAFTNSGTNTVTLNAQTQSYSGGSGSDVVTISADATKAISGGAGTNTLVLNNTAGTFTAANTVKNATGFTTLGTGAASQGTYDLGTLTGFNAINVGANVAGATTFTKVTAGTGLTLNAATTANITYQTSDTLGATDSTTVTLKGISATGGGTKGYTVGSDLTIQDANGVGHGTVAFVTDASVGGGAFIVTKLVDSALSNLSVTGTGSLTITDAATTSTQLTISDNNTSTGASGITTLASTGSVLGSLSYSGTHAFTIGTLTDSVANLSITNANTGTTGVLTIGAHANANLSSLTLNGAVAYTGTSTTTGAATVSGSTDNQVVSMTFDRTAAGVKTVTLGNGNNTVVTGTAADKITLGTGANTVTAGAGADTITFGAHTGVVTLNYNANVAGGGDSGTFAVPVTNTISTTTFDIVTGIKAGDRFVFDGIGGGASYTTVANGTTANTLVGLVTNDNALEFVRGTYDATGKTFVGSSTGVDSLMVYDSDELVSTDYEAIVLVGYVANSVTAIGGANGVFTFA